MKLRSRIVAIVAMVLLLAGLGAQFGPSASASTNVNTSDTNGCVVVRPLQLAICIPRL
jgi:hypothetical protein